MTWLKKTVGFSAELISLTCPSKWRCSASAVLWLSLPAMDILLWLACCWHNGGRFISNCALQLQKKKLTHWRDCFNVVAQNTQACWTSSATNCIAEFCECCQVAQEVLAAPQMTCDFLQIKFPPAALASLVSTDGYQFAFLLLIVTVSGAKRGLRKYWASENIATTFLDASFASLAFLVFPSMLDGAFDLCPPTPELLRALAWIAAALICSFNTLVPRFVFKTGVQHRVLEQRLSRIKTVSGFSCTKTQLHLIS